MQAFMLVCVFKLAQQGIMRSLIEAQNGGRGVFKLAQRGIMRSLMFRLETIKECVGEF